MDWILMANVSNSLVLRPETLEEAAVQVSQVLVGNTIVPRGGGTKWDRFLCPDKYTVLSTELLRAVVDYSPCDMTITVEAGMRLDALATVLAEKLQRLPLDPPQMPGATVGGMLAANDSGPIRLANGTARDWVVGMKIILSDGTVVKSGGRVVKNVAGYDLHKLLIGSFGSLGIIGEVTFKLGPIPEMRRAVVLKPPDVVQAERMMQEILRGVTRPTGIELINARAARMLGVDSPLGALLLVVLFEETAEATAWQCERIVEQFGSLALACDDQESDTLYTAIREWPARKAEWSFKANLLSSNVAGFFHQCGWHPIALLAHAGNGIVYGQSQEDLANGILEQVQAEAAAAGGNLTLLASPPRAVRARWGRPRPDAFLMQRVKTKFDPKGVFVNGPFVANGSPG
jgi:glycolate oxidase FAD binding subunit